MFKINSRFILLAMFIIGYMYTLIGKPNIFFVGFLLLFFFIAPTVYICRGGSLLRGGIFAWAIFFGWHFISFLIFPLLTGETGIGDGVRSTFFSFFIGVPFAVIVCAIASTIKSLIDDISTKLRKRYLARHESGNSK